MRAAPLLFLLAGCNAPDGYRFDEKEFERTPVTVSIVTHETVADLRAAAPPAATVGEDHDLMAWSEIRGSRCEIHVVDPAVAYQPEWLGHELAHCVWGRWHP